MAKEERQKRPRHTTPAGIAVYPRINGTPDTKFNADGVWSIKVKFANETEAAKVIKLIDEGMAQALVEAKADEKHMASLKKRSKKPTALDKPYFIDEETGEVTVGFKMTASGTSKKTGQAWNMKPAVFDAQGAIMPSDARIGSGSKVKVAFEVGPFHTPLGYGVSLRLVAVQVLELVEWGSGKAEDYGFDVEGDDDADDSQDSDEDTDDAEGSDDF